MQAGSGEAYQEYRDHCTCDKGRPDGELVAGEFLGHVDSGKGGDYQANGDNEEEDFGGEQILRLGRGFRAWGLRFGSAGRARWRRGSARWQKNRLFLMQLAHNDHPLRWLVAAAFSGFVQREGLQRTGGGKEQNGWRYEDTCIKMNQSEGADQ